MMGATNSEHSTATPTVEAVRERVRALGPVLRERAATTEARRSIPTESMADLRDAGVFAMLRPRRFGGLECAPVDFYSVVRDVASACGSTGWVASIMGVHAWHLALFPDQAQHEVWDADPEAFVCSSYAPLGSGTVVDGGYRISGAWRWSSGIEHADWVLLGGPVLEGGKPIDFVAYLVPRSDFTVVDVWNVVGLEGTGSNEVVAEDVFVPSHRALSFRAMGDGTAPGLAENTAPMYRMPWGTMHPSAVTAPIVGMAQGAYRAHVEHQGARIRAAYAGETAWTDSFAQARVGEASSDIDAAWLQLSDNLTRIHDALVAGDKVTMEMRRRARRDQVRATGRAVDAIDLLFENSGASALSRTSPMQRFWRDAHAGRVHAANDAERAYVMFGAGEFGLPATDSMV